MYEKIANEFIDWYCACFEIKTCIQFLMNNCNLTKSELIYNLGFMEDDVDEAIAANEEE